MVETICRNLESIRARLDDAAARAHRRSDEIRLMAVTKNQPREAVLAAHEAGIRLFGENRVQEALGKYDDLPFEAELHLIGHLQRNKAKLVAGRFAAVQSIDKAATAEALAHRLEGAEQPFPVMLEVNTSGEDSKYGLWNDEDVHALAEQLQGIPSLSVVGLMTIGPLTSDESQLRRSFGRLRTLMEELRSRHPELPLRELSMGMTNDFEIAVEEGSTMVRIGTALFGPRLQEWG